MEKQISRTTYVLRNLFIGSASQILILLLSFISRTVFIKCLGNEYLSVNGIFTNILTILTFTDLGIGSAVIYSLYEPLAKGDKLKIGKIVNLLSKAYTYIAFAIFLLGILVIPFLQFIISDVPNVIEDIRLLYILFLLNTVFSYVWGYKKSLLIADQKNYIVVILYSVLHTLQILFQIVILLYYNSFISYLILAILFTIINNLISSIYVDKTYNWLKTFESFKLEKAERNQIFSNIKNIVIYKLGSVILNGSSNIIVSIVIKTTYVGICSNYIMIINAVQAIINQGFSGISATIGNYNIDAKPEENESIYTQLCLLSFWAFGSITIVLGQVLNPLINIWLGQKFLLDNTTVFALVLGFYIFSINTIPYSYRTALGLFKECRVAPIYAAILNVILGFFLGKIFGIAGIFFATVISRLFTYCLIDPFFIYKKAFHSSSKKYFVNFFKEFCLIIFIYLLSFIVTSCFSFSCILTIFFNGLTGLIFFNICFFVFYRKDTSFLKLKSLFINKIRHNII